VATLNFNANEVPPAVGFEPVPTGKYLAVITSSEMKPTKAGTGQYLELEMQIVEGEFKGRKLWARLNLTNPSLAAVEIARSELSAICRAVGVMTPRDSVELHNLPLVLTVTLGKRADNGEPTNEIKGYEARTAATQPVATVPQAGGPVEPAPWDRK